MVIEPVDDKRTEEPNLNRADPVQRNQARTEKAKKDEKKQIIPSLQNIVHNSFYDWFPTFLVRPEEVKVQFQTNRLNKIDPNLEVELFGQVYRKENMQELLPDLTEIFSRELADGNTSEVLANLKRLPPDIQFNLINSLLDQVGSRESGILSSLSGYWRDAQLMDFIKLVISDNTILANFSREQRNQLLERISEKDLPAIIRYGVDSINALRDVAKVVFGTIAEKIQVIVDDTRQITTLTERLTNQENITNSDLDNIRKLAEKTRLTIAHARLEVNRLKALGETEQVMELENKIIVMQQAVQELREAAETFLSNSNDEDQKRLVQNILQTVNSLYEQRIIEIADYIRDQARQGIRINLSNESLAIVNQVLVNNNVTMLDRGIFTRNDSDMSNDMQQVIMSNYDLSFQENGLANLQISTSFIYDTVFSIFKTDREERQRLREQRLADARQVDKFIEQYQERIKETQKRLDKIAFQKALSKFSNTITMYRNIVQEIIRNYGNNESKLAWYKCLLETEQQKQIARTIFELNKNLG